MKNRPNASPLFTIFLCFLIYFTQTGAVLAKSKGPIESCKPLKETKSSAYEDKKEKLSKAIEGRNKEIEAQRDKVKALTKQLESTSQGEEASESSVKKMSKTEQDEMLRTSAQLEAEQKKLNDLIADKGKISKDLSNLEAGHAAEVNLQSKNPSDWDLFEVAITGSEGDYAKGPTAQSNIHLMTMASSAVNALDCSPKGDTNSSSLPMFRAAAAAYIVNQMNQMKTFKKSGSCNIQEESTLEGDGEKREKADSATQVELIEKAAQQYIELVETAQVKTKSREDSLKMFQEAYEEALKELEDKMTRIGTAKENVEKAKGWVKKTGIKLGIVSVLVIVLWALLWTIPLAIALTAYNIWLIFDLVKAIKFKIKWETELSKAQNHTHLHCNNREAKKFNPLKDAESEFGGALGLQTGSDTFGNFLNMKKSNWLDQSHDVSSQVDLSAIPVNLDAIKEEDRKGFPIPETRVLYIQATIQTIMSNYNLMLGALKSLNHNKNKYVQLVQNVKRQFIDDGPGLGEGNVEERKSETTCLKKTKRGKSLQSDPNCKCKDKGNCGKFDDKRFRNLKMNSIKAMPTVKAANAFMAGDLNKANIALGDLRQNAVKIRDSISKREKRIESKGKAFLKMNEGIKENAEKLVSIWQDRTGGALRSSQGPLSTPGTDGNKDRKSRRSSSSDDEEKSILDKSETKKAIKKATVRSKKRKGKKKKSKKEDKGPGEFILLDDDGEEDEEVDYGGLDTEISSSQGTKGDGSKLEPEFLEGGVNPDQEKSLFDNISDRYKKSGFKRLLKRKK